MVSDRYKVGALILHDNDYELKITCPKTDKTPELRICPPDREWGPLVNLEKEDQVYKIKNRTGIWFEKDKSDFYSKVSLFEETEYYFELISPKKLKQQITTQTENNENKIETNRHNKDLNTEEHERKDFGKTLLFNRFFESNAKWISGVNSKEEKKYKIIMKTLWKNKKWSVNFKSYTGRLKIKKSIIGNDLNDIEIIPKKLTKENYFQILNGLNTFISQIFFIDKSPTEISATRDYISTEIEKAGLYDCAKYLLLNSIMTELPRYFYGLMKRLNTKFFYFDDEIEVYELKNVSNINFVQTLTTPSNLLLLSNVDSTELPCFPINGGYFTFDKLNVNLKDLSNDTPENRFIKFVLKLLYYELNKEQIRRFFREIEKHNNLLILNDYLTELSEKINFLHREEVNDLQLIPYNSQILQKNSYYRRFLQYFMWLQNPTTFNVDELFFIDIKPMWLLYEYYCLYTMKSSLDSIVNDGVGLLEFPENLEKHIECQIDDNNTEYRAVKYIKLEYKNRNGEIIQLIYQPFQFNFEVKEILRSYSKLTGQKQKPDFILVKSKDGKICSYKGKKNWIVVIDSKYRIESEDLWIKMHFYKDALKALGAIFINPKINENNYSGRLLTPYGELTEDKTNNEKAIRYGFVSGINLLGLKDSKNPTIEFKNMFKIILEKYFQ